MMATLSLMPSWAIVRSEERRVGKECRCRWAQDQAEDGIRDLYVTGVQTCALPIFARGDADAAQAVRLGQLDEVRVLERRGDVAPAVEELLPLAHHAEVAVVDDGHVELDALLGDREIGRASCRERV